MDKKPTFYFLVSGTVIMMMIMQFNGKQLVTPEVPSGIINLELANTKLKAKLIINSWAVRSTPENDLIARAKTNTHLDFIFLLFYSPFLFVACRRLADYISSGKRIKKWLNSFAYLALLCGLLDIVENIGMLITLNRTESDYVTLFTAVAALIKWVSVIAVLILIIAGLLMKWNENKHESAK